MLLLFPFKILTIDLLQIYIGVPCKEPHLGYYRGIAYTCVILISPHDHVGSIFVHMCIQKTYQATALIAFPALTLIYYMHTEDELGSIFGHLMAFNRSISRFNFTK